MENKRFARAPWLGLMHTRRGESPSEQSPAHRWQLSHWPSLQSFLLLPFSARKIPHPPSGCRKRSYSLWMRRQTKNKGEIVVRAVAAGSGPACQHLADSIPGRFAKPNTARCVTNSTSPPGDMPGTPANGLCCPTSSCLPAFWRGACHTLPFLVFPSSGCLPSSTGEILARVVLLWPARPSWLQSGSPEVLLSPPTHLSPSLIPWIAGLGAISQDGFKP